MPPSKSWTAYNVRIFGYKANYEKAQQCRDHFMLTSSVETDDEEQKTQRKRKRSQKAIEFEDCVDKLNNEMSSLPMKKCPRKSMNILSIPPWNNITKPELPVAPSMSTSTPSPPRASRSPQASKSPVNTSFVEHSIFNDNLDYSLQEDEPEETVAPPSRLIPRDCSYSSGSSAVRQQLELPEIHLQPKKPTQSRTQGMTASNQSRGSSTARQEQDFPEIRVAHQPKKPTQSSSTARGGNDDSLDAFKQSVMRRLMAIEEKQEEQLTLLRKLTLSLLKDQTLDTEDVIPEPLAKPEDLEALSEELKTKKDLRKKMVKYFATLRQETVRKTVRKILGKVGKNDLWSKYSMKGMKGKKKLEDMTISTTIIKGTLVGHPNTDSKRVEDAMSETLKHCPFKDRKRIKEPAVEQQRHDVSSDSD